MPDFCAAYGCSNRRCLQTRQRGITFHSTMICSEHFKAGDFDRTGQTVRLKAGVKPTIFSFPAHLQKVIRTRTTATSRRADDSLDVSEPNEPGTAGERRKEQKSQATDHAYGLPACPKYIKAKLDAASARIRKLEREKSDAMKREMRAKECIQSLLKELKDKNLITEELNDHLECYSDLPVHLLSRPS
nr:THAP domain-containing protein 6 isoform X2 [Nothobranchius furzeri]